MDCITITTAGISKLLCKLDPRKAPGPDNISPRVLKELYFSIAPTLQVIYGRSYNDGVVPYDWLHANVCPIYKKGTRKAPVNYRPISTVSQATTGCQQLSIEQCCMESRLHCRCCTPTAHASRLSWGCP